MKLYDQHLHSRYSFDSKADPGANVEAALAQGLGGLTFTEHFDTHPSDWDGCVYDDASYSATIDGLRQRFGDRLFIGKGIEVCYQPDRMKFILDFLDTHEFDLVILSVHYFGSLPVYKKENWEGIEVEAGMRRYLEQVFDAVQTCATLTGRRGRCFDVLGHLDFVKRYTQRFFGIRDVTPFGQLLDEILRTCLEADLTPEVNTSTLRQNIGETMPSSDTIARFARMGGTSMTLGSDAHRSEDIAADFQTAVEMLRMAGIHQLTLFQQRRKHLLPL